MRKCALKSCRAEIPSKKDSDCWQEKGYCNVECMSLHGLEKGRQALERKRKADELGIKKRKAEFKRNFQRTDLKIRKDAAKTACHAYIRERDKGQPCICCGRPLGEKYDAGHFLESGNNSKIRYHEDNIHAQSVYCNQYKGGNSDDYEGRLREKIGDERVDYLLANKGGAVKRTVDDYIEIENYFKDKLKKLKESRQSVDI